MNEDDRMQLSKLRKPGIVMLGGFGVFFIFLIAVSIAGGFPVERPEGKVLLNNAGIFGCTKTAWFVLVGLKWCSIVAGFVGMMSMGYVGNQMRVYDESVPTSRQFLGVSTLTTTLIFAVGFPLWITTVLLLGCAWFNVLHQSQP